MHYKYQVKKAIRRQNKKDSSIDWRYDVDDKGHSVFIEIIGKEGGKEVSGTISLSKRTGYMATFFRVNSKIDLLRNRLMNKKVDKSFLEEDSFTSQS